MELHTCECSKCRNGETHLKSSVTISQRPGQANHVLAPEWMKVVKNLQHIYQFHKGAVRWVPKQLTLELKQLRVDVREESLRRYEAEGNHA